MNYIECESAIRGADQHGPPAHGAALFNAVKFVAARSAFPSTILEPILAAKKSYRGALIAEIVSGSQVGKAGAAEGRRREGR